MQDKDIVLNYNDLRVGKPKVLRAMIDRDGAIKIKRGKEIVHVLQEMRGILVGISRPRVYWESNDGDSSAPDCSAKDGISGFGRHTVAQGERSLVPDKDGEYPIAEDGSLVIERKCSSCPHSQFISGAPACKQQVRLGIYLPIVNDLTPWLSANLLEDGQNEPVFLSLSPSNLREWDAYVGKLQSIKFPYNLVWTRIKGGTKTAGSYTVGYAEFEFKPMGDSDEWYYNDALSLTKHPAMIEMTKSGSGEDYQMQSD